MCEDATWGGGGCGDKASLQTAQQNPVSEMMLTLTAGSTPEDGLMFQSASSASHGHRERDKTTSLFVYEPLYFSVTPRLHFVTSVLNVSAFSDAFWLDFTFCRLDKEYHCTETQLWVGTVFGYMAKEWARGLMELGDKGSVFLRG